MPRKKDKAPAEAEVNTIAAAKYKRLVPEITFGQTEKPLLIPTGSTLAAISRLNTVRGVEMTMREFFEWQLKLYPEYRVNIKRWLGHLDRRDKLIGAVDRKKTILYDIGYKRKERRVKKNPGLTEQELDDYLWNVLMLLHGDKLKYRFHDRSLEEGEEYPQSLKGYRLFIVRKDPAHIKRKKKNPEEKSRAIICLYARRGRTVTFCNIGRPDKVVFYADSIDRQKELLDYAALWLERLEAIEEAKDPKNYIPITFKKLMALVKK